MDNYKGIYYKESKEQKYYEGGAHFRYKDLFQILISLGGIILEKEYYYSNMNQNIDTNRKKIIYSNSQSNKFKKQKQKIKTRNLANLNYVNNPNTKISVNGNKIHRKNNLSINNVNHLLSKNKTILFNNYFIDEKKSNNNTNDNNSTFNLMNCNTQRYIPINNLSRTILNNINKNNIIKKIKSKNDINSNINSKGKTNIYNYLKYFHQRTRSDAFISNKNNFNNSQIYNNLINRNNNKIFSQKNNFNNLNNNKNTYITNNNNNINSINSYEKNKDISVNSRNHNCLMSSFKSQTNKNKLNFEINVSGKNIKKSRNIINRESMTYRKTFENKKSLEGNSINNIFLSNDNENANNNISSMIVLNNNKTINRTINNNNILSPRNIMNLASKINYNGKTLNNIGKSILFEKYVKKKINQSSALNNFINNNNSSNKNGKNIFSKNINDVGIKNKEQKNQI